MMAFGSRRPPQNRLLQGVTDAAAHHRSRLSRRSRLLRRRGRDAARPRAGDARFGARRRTGASASGTRLDGESLRDRALVPLRQSLAELVLQLNPRTSVGGRRAEAARRRPRTARLPDRVPRRQGLLLAVGGALVLRLDRLGRQRRARCSGSSSARRLLRPRLLRLIDARRAPRADPRRAARMRSTCSPSASRPASGFDGAIAKLTEHMEGPLAEEFGLTLVGDADRREPRRGAQAPRRARRHAGDLVVHPRDHPGRPARHLARAGSCASRPPTRGCAVRQPPRRGR